jgi:hypothetical protein
VKTNHDELTKYQGKETRRLSGAVPKEPQAADRMTAGLLGLAVELAPPHGDKSGSVPAPSSPDARGTALKVPPVSEDGTPSLAPNAKSNQDKADEVDGLRPVVMSDESPASSVGVPLGEAKAGSLESSMPGDWNPLSSEVSDEQANLASGVKAQESKRLFPSFAENDHSDPAMRLSPLRMVIVITGFGSSAASSAGFLFLRLMY